MMPLVSVVTATRDRPELALACLDQVAAQTYRPLEHVIVSDGPDPDLRALIAKHRPSYWDGLRVVFAETGRCWSDELAHSPGAAAFLVAQYLAAGTLQMWLSDDEEMDNHHVGALVSLLEQTQSDFVYSKAEWWVPDRPELTRVIGAYPPTPDQITNALYRTALLDYAAFTPGVGHGTDWHQIGRWLEAGARCAMVDRVTFRHRADQVGGATPARYRQPLRGLDGQGEYAGPYWRGRIPIDVETGRPVPIFGVS